MPCTYVIEDFYAEKIDGTFYVKELQKKNQINFRTGKVIKKKVDNLFNGWIDENT